MQVFLLIVLQVILPVFVLILIGVFFHRKYSFDLGTLSKMLNYIFLPVVGFSNMYSSHFSGTTFAMIVGFLLFQNGVLMIFTEIVSRLFKFDRRLAATYKNSVVLNNSGNFGIPISQLVFTGNPLGQSIQVIVMIFQNIITNTYGLMNAMAGQSKGILFALKEFLRNPILYGMLLGLILNLTHLDLPIFIEKPIDTLTAAFLAVALITLGAQSAYLKITKISTPLVLSLVGRLLISPTIALGIILILGIEGTVAQALFIASSFPSSRNSALFALEYDNYPEYAAQTVILSTIFSSITVAVVVYLSQILF